MRRVNHTNRRCNQEDQMKPALLELRKRKSGRRRRKERSLLGNVLFLCRFSPIYASAHIPLYDRECDVDIAHVVEVRAPDCETTIAADDELLSSDYERSDASL